LAKIISPVTPVTLAPVGVMSSVSFLENIPILEI
jgi:hypothetical protein